MAIRAIQYKYKNFMYFSKLENRTKWNVKLFGAKYKFPKFPLQKALNFLGNFSEQDDN
jgi:hypothetical protein